MFRHALIGKNKFIRNNYVGTTSLIVSTLVSVGHLHAVLSTGNLILILISPVIL